MGHDSDAIASGIKSGLQLSPIPEYHRSKRHTGTRMLRALSGVTVGLAWPLMLVLGAGTHPGSAQEAGGRSTEEMVAAHLGRGYELLEDYRYQEAAKEFQAALALQPGHVRARYQFGVCCFALGKTQESREEFNRLQKEIGAEPTLLYYLGRLDLREGNFDAAIRRLEQVVANSPFPDTAYYLGVAYLEKRAFEQAGKWLGAAAQANPCDYRVPDHLALSLPPTTYSTAQGANSSTTSHDYGSPE
jgi:tetratricopeptide (TPR) repeat protein